MILNILNVEKVIRYTFYKLLRDKVSSDNENLIMFSVRFIFLRYILEASNKRLLSTILQQQQVGHIKEFAYFRTLR